MPATQLEHPLPPPAVPIRPLTNVSLIALLTTACSTSTPAKSDPTAASTATAPTPAAADGTRAERATGPTRYACPMHPDVTADAVGDCPKCGMALVERDAEGEDHDHSAQDN